MTAIRGLLCLVSLAASVLASPAQEKRQQKPPEKPPNILLITLDTTRADRMGFLGSKRGLTPNLDALARDSAVFTHAYSQAPLTPTSHATILTGTYPQFHQVNDFRVPLARDLPYAPDILHAHGYRTAAFVGSVVLDPATSYAPGFDRGFDTYNAGFDPEAIRQKGRFETIERRGNLVVARALAWLTQHPKGPFFLWVHLYDAHDPYDPPEPYKSQYPSEPYDGEIAYEDAAVGKLLGQLKARGLYDGAVIAVMSDHGESLGAHGEDTHGIFLYDETIHVPLVIKLPGKNGAAKSTAKPTTERIDDKVELVDVMPTLLQAAAIAVPAEVQGQSLMGLMTGRATIAANPATQRATGISVEAWRDRPAYAETDYPRTAFGWSALRSLRTGKYLYVRAPRQELYDEVADAEAEHNLAGESTAVADTLKARLDSFRQGTSNNREAPKAAVDPAAQEKLAALGYVSGGGNAAAKGSADQAADPKDKIEISNLNHQANALRQSGRPGEAVLLLQQLLVKEPDMPNVYGELGECYLDLQEFQKALPLLQKAKELDPESPTARLRLAKALMGVGDFAAAVPELEFAVGKIPSYAEAHLFLEMAYARTNRIPETIKECQTVLEFFPEHFGSYLILGRFLELSGDFAGAVPKLKKAAALDPKAPEPHMFLGDAYDQLGRKADAARERAAAKRLAANHEE